MVTNKSPVLCSDRKWQREEENLIGNDTVDLPRESFDWYGERREVWRWRGGEDGESITWASTDVTPPVPARPH